MPVYVFRAIEWKKKIKYILINIVFIIKTKIKKMLFVAS